MHVCACFFLLLTHSLSSTWTHVQDHTHTHERWMTKVMFWHSLTGQQHRTCYSYMSCPEYLFILWKILQLSSSFKHTHTHNVGRPVSYSCSFHYRAATWCICWCTTLSGRKAYSRSLLRSLAKAWSQSSQDGPHGESGLWLFVTHVRSCIWDGNLDRWQILFFFFRNRRFGTWTCSLSGTELDEKIKSPLTYVL